jgi:hypothetical protein
MRLACIRSICKRTRQTSRLFPARPEGALISRTVAGPAPAALVSMGCPFFARETPAPRSVGTDWHRRAMDGPPPKDTWTCRGPKGRLTAGRAKRALILIEGHLSLMHLVHSLIGNCCLRTCTCVLIDST